MEEAYLLLYIILYKKHSIYYFGYDGNLYMDVLEKVPVLLFKLGIINRTVDRTRFVPSKSFMDLFISDFASCCMPIG